MNPKPERRVNSMKSLTGAMWLKIFYHSDNGKKWSFLKTVPLTDMEFVLSEDPLKHYLKVEIGIFDFEDIRYIGKTEEVFNSFTGHAKIGFMKYIDPSRLQEINFLERMYNLPSNKK